MKLFYRLPDVDNDIPLEVSDPEDKFFTLIYGPNGIGKSSFANSVKKIQRIRIFVMNMK